MKIFKLFVCLLLILSTSLVNSLAAISVSDGSAFVTKAEFAADLNNLSNRMSSLENSLDAKIDSLVSSYLSRNGIWNGEKQTFSTEKFDLHDPTWKDFTTSNSSQTFDSKSDNMRLFEASKSGMILLNFRFKGRGGTSSVWGYMNVLPSGGNKYLSDDNIVLSLNVSKESNNQLMSSYVIGTASGSKRNSRINITSRANINNNSVIKELEPDIYFFLCVPLSPEYVSSTLLFFVEKGETYYAYSRGIANLGYIDSTKNVKDLQNGGGVIEFLDSYVY